MAKAKKLEVSANPVEVVFPLDVHQFSQALRKVGLEAAGNIRGNQNKLSILIETLEILIAHSKLRFVKQKSASRANAAAAVKRAEEAAVIERARAVKRRDALKVTVAELQAQIDKSEA